MVLAGSTISMSFDLYLYLRLGETYNCELRSKHFTRTIIAAGGFGGFGGGKFVNRLSGSRLASSDVHMLWIATVMSVSTQLNKQLINQNEHKGLEDSCCSR